MQTTTDIIKRIADINPDIDEIVLINYAPQKDLFQTYKDVWSDEDDTAYEYALMLRQDKCMPFWYSLMLSVINQDREIPWNCLRGAIKHNEVKIIQRIKPADIDHVKDFLYEGGRMAINSKVKMIDGTYRYIPMMDFHVSVSPRNLELVKSIVSIFGETGYVLNSGRSYHFIGKNLMTHEENISFLGKALLSAPIVDEIWIAHQLQDGSCSLRIGEKYGKPPYLETEV